jgi:hypothetical protein
MFEVFLMMLCVRRYINLFASFVYLPFVNERAVYRSERLPLELVLWFRVK